MEVNVPLQSIEIKGEQSTIKKGTTTQLCVICKPEDTTDNISVTWASEDPNIATVSQEGLVTAVSDGTTNIKAIVGNLEAVYAITVQEIKLESITIKEATTIHRGETETLEVIYNPETTTDDKTVKWESSDPTIATVDGNGTVTALVSGQTNITAIVGNHKATCTVTVDVPLKEIIPTETTIQMIKNQTAVIEYILNPEDTTDDQEIMFTSSDPNVATVNEITGLVTAKSAGDAVITLTGSNGITATVAVNVKEIPIDTIVLNKYNAFIEKGESIELKADVQPANNTDDNKTITWNSSDESVATVSHSITDAGESVEIVATQKGGSATITAIAWNGTKASCTIIVPTHVESIVLPQNVSLNRGKTTVLNVMYNPETHNDKISVTWSSDNNDIATVDSQSGMITGIKEGTATITATALATTLQGTITEYKAQTIVTVKENHLSEDLGNAIVFEEMKEPLLKGQFLDMNDQLNLNQILSENEITDDISLLWTSSDIDVATIDQSGQLLGLKEGITNVKVVITAKDGFGQIVDEYTVTTTVEVQEISLESIAFNKIIKEMQKGATETLHIIYNPDNTTDLKEVQWSSSDASVISVDNGKLTALKPGIAIITARVGDKEVTCEILVKDTEAIESVTGDGSLTSGTGSVSEQGTAGTSNEVVSVHTGDPGYMMTDFILLIGAMVTFIIINIIKSRKFER